MKKKSGIVPLRLSPLESSLLDPGRPREAGDPAGYLAILQSLRNHDRPELIAAFGARGRHHRKILIRELPLKLLFGGNRLLLRRRLKRHHENVPGAALYIAVQESRSPF